MSLLADSGKFVPVIDFKTMLKHAYGLNHDIFFKYIIFSLHLDLATPIIIQMTQNRYCAIEMRRRKRLNSCEGTLTRDGML